MTDIHLTNIHPWGLYPWFATHNPQFVHPNDVPLFTMLRPFGKLFQKVNETEGYFVLRYRDGFYRVRPEIFKPVAAPTLDFGQMVVDVRQPSKIGQIYDIEWHEQQNGPVYYIAVNGRRDAKRYYEGELKAIG